MAAPAMHRPSSDLRSGAPVKSRLLPFAALFLLGLSACAASPDTNYSYAAQDDCRAAVARALSTPQSGLEFQGEEQGAPDNDPMRRVATGTVVGTGVVRQFRCEMSTTDSNQLTWTLDKAVYLQ